MHSSVPVTSSATGHRPRPDYHRWVRDPCRCNSSNAPMGCTATSVVRRPARSSPNDGRPRAVRGSSRELRLFDERLKTCMTILTSKTDTQNRLTFRQHSLRTRMSSYWATRHPTREHVDDGLVITPAVSANLVTAIQMRIASSVCPTCRSISVGSIRHRTRPTAYRSDFDFWPEWRATGVRLEGEGTERPATDDLLASTDTLQQTGVSVFVSISPRYPTMDGNDFSPGRRVRRTSHLTTSTSAEHTPRPTLNRLVCELYAVS